MVNRIVWTLPILSLTIIFVCFSATAQTPAPTSQETPAESPAGSPDPSPTPATTPLTTPTPIPLGEVFEQAEVAAAALREVEENLATDQSIISASSELPAITREIDSRRDETARALAPGASLATLRELEQSWEGIADALRTRRRALTNRATQLNRELERLARLSSAWEQTLDLARSSQSPPQIINRIEDLTASIAQTTERVERQRGNVLTLQNRIAEQEVRVADALATVRDSRSAVVSRLFVRDSVPIWSEGFRSLASTSLLQETQNSFAAQFSALRIYFEQRQIRFFFHGIVFLLFAGALYRARWRVRPWIEKEPILKPAAVVFELPFASALLLTLIASNWIYPEAPKMLRAILGAAALVPTVIILRRLIERHLLPILNALVVFYFVDQLRAVAEPQELLSRLLFIFEMLGGILFMVWVIKAQRFADQKDGRSEKTIRFGARIAIAVFGAALFANAIGYVSLATLLGNAVLGSAYLAVILYAATRVADGLIMFALRMKPLSSLGMVRLHRGLLRRRVRRFIQWVAVLLWAFYALEMLTLRTPLIEFIRAALASTLTVGSFSISLGDVLAFALTVWLAFLISRFMRFLLEEDIYPRLGLARGLPYAISTVLHYLILLAGFLIAVAAVGVDMTRFTILAGAFGVGLGFGLQNIVNNFVSGLIVLFERPVKVGDIVEINNAIGIVKRIGIRASVLGGWDGAEIIVPNGALISERLTNWTLSNVQRGIQIKVGVAYGSDPEQVIELLKRVAAEHELIVDDPAPQAFFIDFGADSLNFELRAWTIHFLEWVKIRSDLSVAINGALAEANISIPFPQRDLHLRSIDPAASKQLRGE
ncbi:MAG TPA: mechanosensitive ion channel domain-containing protein [Pyrinomonadaceae bacterium]|nr:mechanosensitive ion channel domain-containing protein [Pyrinomonadaceae bacterium]